MTRNFVIIISMSRGFLMMNLTLIGRFTKALRYFLYVTSFLSFSQVASWIEHSVISSPETAYKLSGRLDSFVATFCFLTNSVTCFYRIRHGMFDWFTSSLACRDSATFAALFYASSNWA